MRLCSEGIGTSRLLVVASRWFLQIGGNKMVPMQIQESV